ncbi:YqiJ family protein [Ruegeria sp. 2012CJ41-6]|uniref:YqiJ family protein n=1 Tax=Ruegeria spongiae TaxID=2942209 RepID=A0ABT0Q4R8_9RHOB|nr:OB-fold-containig protein [Ruegeria spongiae]MCL6283909.1 YqiJ family protein [Ruegeria spongiae]
MFDFLLEGAFAAFTMALALLLGLLVLELVALMVGGSLMAGEGEVDLDVADAPDLDGFDLDIDADLDVDVDLEVDLDPGELGEAALDAPAGDTIGSASWLGLGKMPTMIWLATLLMGFGLSGLGLQMALRDLIGLNLPGWLAAIPAAAFGIWFARGFGAVFARLLPHTETESTSVRRLSRHRGVITQGTASKGRPAEVRVIDRFGNAHYLRAEPMREGETLSQGTEVLVLRDRRSGSFVLIGMSE